MYAFLSEEWMAAAREIRARHQGELPPITQVIRVNQVITDVPFGDGVVHAYVDTSTGGLALELGALDEPDAVMTTDYETALSLLIDRDPAFAMQSFLAGRVKVQGDMMKLIAMMGALSADERSEAVANELDAITERPQSG